MFFYFQYIFFIYTCPFLILPTVFFALLAARLLAQHLNNKSIKF